MHVCTETPALLATLQDPYEPSFGTSIVSLLSLAAHSKSSLMQTAVTVASLAQPGWWHPMQVKRLNLSCMGALWCAFDFVKPQ